MKKVFNFENFYVYDGNRVAYLTAQKIIQFPGELFNPFYVYGGTGIGKSHLLWAIHFELSKKFTTLFFNGKEFSKYLEETKEFNIPVIVDDIHILADKYQDILLEIIDVFLSNNKQVCFSANAAPREIKNFNTKLLSRLEGGLVCDIQPPKEMALVGLIKKKSEELGIILPDDIALELAQLSSGSIRTIEGMVNRLIAYSSLGNLPLDINSVRLILKDFYPKGIYTPVSSLLEELKKNVTEVLEEIPEKVDARNEYKEKIYIWEMKGFDTSSLKNFVGGDIEVLKEEYNKFLKKVERLIELQKEFGALETSVSPDESLKIESMLFSPDKIDEIDRHIEKIKMPKPLRPMRTFETFIIGECNKIAYNLYRNQIFPSLGVKLNPFVVIGNKGTGKTHYLESIYMDLKAKGKYSVFIDNILEAHISEKSCEGVDALIIDNFGEIFTAAEDLRKKWFGIILYCIKENKEIIISLDKSPFDFTLSDDERMIFELGIEVEIRSPSSDTIGDYIKSKLGEQIYDKISKKGLPVFSTFLDLFDYVSTYKPEAPEIVEEVVPLGLPGEEAVVKEERMKEEEVKEEVVPAKEEVVPIEKEVAPVKEEVVSAKEEVVIEEKPPTIESPSRVLKENKEKRFILPEIIGELLEEKYQ